MVKQPENSKLCGHCCLAVILNISLEESVKLIGHSRGTQSKELTDHFNSSKNKRGYPNCYSLCIARPSNKIKDWHWIIYKDRLIYDPILGRWVDEESFFNEVDLIISSYFEIKIP